MTDKNDKNNNRIVTMPRDCCQQRINGITSRQELPNINGLVERLMAEEELKTMHWTSLVRSTLETLAPDLLGEQLDGLDYTRIVEDLVYDDREDLRHNVLELLATVLYQRQQLQGIVNEMSRLQDVTEKMEGWLTLI